MPGVAPR